MAVSTTYHYVVLRLATDDLRGEVINVGAVLFHPQEKPRTLVMATLNKLRAIDATWDGARLAAWAANVERLATGAKSHQHAIDALGAFGFCDPNALGMFSADSEADVARELAEIKATYVANRAGAERPQRERRTRLQTALRQQFERMHIMGREAGDIHNHLVVANVPVPACPELKADFVYRNGVYRVTQTLDYNVAPDSLHNKLAEACVKSTAAEMAMKTYGDNTLRLAVVDIPDALRDATDAHIDLLLHQGFQVFHYGNASDMDSYLQKAAPGAPRG